MSIKVIMSRSKILNPFCVYFEGDKEVRLELWSDGYVGLEFNINGLSFIQDGECNVHHRPFIEN